ncbi:cytochrome b5 [Aspergillus uvarum CBS 121591]|uniref:Cytochrome b5 n=1 Tax=Aspergillus uvarum CBS 121591 TaxID=1448315 RepID=A0A319CCX6_9EURO|nr:cytochrome b5 [Aspergillus uvarum CBS 121591]PYH81217.1 cytochrome b5 [Aspergillus uvarum CBS 121591]
MLHRYTDTDEDPYSIRQGLFHAHLGWMVLAKPQAQPPGKTRRTRRRIDLSDLDADAVVVWQSRYYALLVVLMGWRFPMVTPRDSFLAAVLTLGEKYHNSHHTFPSDYRNGVRWYHYDCTKWAIAGCAVLGLADGLRRAGDGEIERARLQEMQKALTRRMEAPPQAVTVEKLPRVDWAEYRGVVEKGRYLVAVDGVVHDVGAFMAEHPGGEHLIQAWVGKDAMMAFHAGIYRHSKVARNILACVRVAELESGKPGTESQ